MKKFYDYFMRIHMNCPISDVPDNIYALIPIYCILIETH